MDLVYRVGGDGYDGVLFAKRDAAEHVAKIRDALETSKTWGELKANLPEGEWDDHFAGNRDDYEDDDPFDSPDLAPGFADGDYPEWLLQSQLDWFPEDLIKKYAGSLRETRLNGDALELPGDKAEEIADELRARGHTVERTNLNIT